MKGLWASGHAGCHERSYMGACVYVDIHVDSNRDFGNKLFVGILI